MHVAIIPPIAALFTHNPIIRQFDFYSNNVNLLRDKFHETKMIFGAQSRWKPFPLQTTCM